MAYSKLALLVRKLALVDNKSIILITDFNRNFGESIVQYLMEEGFDLEVIENINNFDNSTKTCEDFQPYLLFHSVDVRSYVVHRSISKSD